MESQGIGNKQNVRRNSRCSVDVCVQLPRSWRTRSSVGCIYTTEADDADDTTPELKGHGNRNQETQTPSEMSESSHRLCEDVISVIRTFSKNQPAPNPSPERLPPHKCDDSCDIIRGTYVGMCKTAGRVCLLSELPRHECSVERCGPMLVPQGDDLVCPVSGKTYNGQCPMAPSFGDGFKVPLRPDAELSDHDYCLIRGRSNEESYKRRWADTDYERVSRPTRRKTELELIQHLCKTSGESRKRPRLSTKKQRNKTLVASSGAYFKKNQEFDDWVRDLEDEMMTMAKKTECKKPGPAAERPRAEMQSERSDRVLARLLVAPLTNQKRRRNQNLLPQETIPVNTGDVLGQVYKTFLEAARGVIVKALVIHPSASEIDSLARAFVYLYSIAMSGLDGEEQQTERAYPRFALCVVALILLCVDDRNFGLPKLTSSEGIEKMRLSKITGFNAIDINNCRFFLTERLNRHIAEIRPWDKCKVKPGAKYHVLRNMLKQMAV